MTETDSAVQCAYRMLAYSEKSRYEIRRGLRIKGYSDEAARYAVDKLTESGEIDDMRTAARRAEADVRTKYWGERRIREDLHARGYSEEAADEAIRAIPDGMFEYALGMIAEKKIKVTDRNDRKEITRAVNTVVRYGFTYKEALKCIKEILG